MSMFNLPNTLTVTRIVLIPVFITTLEYERYDYALYIFVLAAFSDLLDGQLARLKSQRTKLGGFLDPLADKFMLMTSYVFFAYYGWVPAWLATIVISRDVIILTGVLLLYLVTNKLRAEPSMPGKTSTVMQLLVLFSVLLNINYGILLETKPVLVWGTAFITSASGLHYIFKGLRLASE
jgi:cardiolipin synthase